MPDVIQILIAVLGLTIGSFLNVLIYRLPRKIPFISDRSRCPGCDSQI
ncbi:MAG: prepilin peptidase, partial [candidate division Zixibacteria bacterium]|nr:prepilin peptidase [candidate division Zixibacteria bacterium]